MKTFHSSFRGMKNQKGTVLIFVTIAILALLAFVALAIDTGYVMVTRNELQNISDASALAATRQLGVLYEGMNYQEQQSFVLGGDYLTAVQNAALTVAASNRAGQKNINLKDSDIIIGQWNASTKTMTQTYSQPDAVQIVSRRDSTYPKLEGGQGPIPTFFANIVGIDEMNVNANAIAALTSESTIGPGELSPIGIDEQWFMKDFCDQNIKFHPTNTPEGCAGWNVFFGDKISDDNASCPGAGHASASCLRKDILERWVNDPTYKTPGAETGDIFQFTGGTLGNNTFQAFLDLFNYMRIRDGDGNDEYWTTSVVVYKDANCENPEGAREIVGFATTIIKNVVPPNVEITAEVKCDFVQTGRGGGGNYGTKGSIPGLVQ